MQLRPTVRTLDGQWRRRGADPDRGRVGGVLRLLRNGLPAASELVLLVEESMARHYFDLRDSDACASDGEGMEFPTLKRHGLKPHGRWRMWHGMRCEGTRRTPWITMAIQVRDGSGPVMQVTFTFEVEPYRK